MTPDEVRAALQAITRELEENRVTVVRQVINPDGTVIRRIYRGSFQQPRDPRNGPHSRGERS
jgi:hypothetical protein